MGTTIDMDPKGDRITWPAFGLHSSPAEYSTVGHIVSDVTGLRISQNRVSDLLTRRDM